MLDNKTVETYLMELGFDDIKSFQKAYMYPKYVDGIYGPQTENALLSAINVKRYTKNFDLKEFRCECGGRYCCGYPSVMKPEVLKNIQSIRDHWNRPVTVTCGLRDKTYNSKLGGSIQNSLHLSGQAIDFYQAGVTDNLANRKSSIKWIKTLPNHHYTYGNGINSYGNGVSAPYMGNALHTDAVYKAPAPSPVTPDGKLVVGGVGGTATVKAMQRFFSTTQDGVITGQKKAQAKYYPALTAVKFSGAASTCVLKMQSWLGVKIDGIWGKNTSIALQKKLGVTADGIFGAKSMKAWQEYLNEHDKAVYPQPVVDPLQPWYDALKTQYNWSKNQEYHFNQNPTVANSKKEGTCITFVAVALQRLGLLPSGKYFYLYPKTHKIAGKGADYAKKHTEIYEISYPKKTLATLYKEGKIKKGDIIGYDNPNYHTMVYKGKNSKGNFIFDTMGGGKRGLNVEYPYYAKRKVGMIVRLKKV